LFFYNTRYIKFTLLYSKSNIVNVDDGSIYVNFILFINCNALYV